MKADPCNRRNSLSRPETDESTAGERKLVKRSTTAWQTQILYESVTKTKTKTVEEDTAKMTKKNATTTGGGGSGNTPIHTSPLTQARQAEFSAWQRDPESQRPREALLILCWAFVFVFTAIPAAFTLAYASTFTDKTAIEWCSR